MINTTTNIYYEFLKYKWVYIYILFIVTSFFCIPLYLEPVQSTPAITAIIALSVPIIAHLYTLARAKNERRLEIYRTLIKHWADHFSVGFVGALNLIHAEFRSFPRVIDEHKKFLVLTTPGYLTSNQQARDQLKLILREMAKVLGLMVDNFDEIIYLPDAWFSENKEEKRKVFGNLVKLLATHPRHPDFIAALNLASWEFVEDAAIIRKLGEFQELARKKMGKKISARYALPLQ